MRVPDIDLASLADDLPDAALLSRFLANRDEVAFAGLVHRHGPMVLGVCRRILGDNHAAEDAFQATFLVLVHRAVDAARDRLGPWLYGVAHRTALKARAASLRRTTREQKVAAARSTTTTDTAPVEVAELAAVIDEELGRLPELLRTAVILCDLQGLSRRQAARQLGCAEGTLSSRLAAARERLARQLTRRGVVPVFAGLVAAVPASLARETTSAALAGAVSSAAGVPVPVVKLSNEVIRTMTLPRKLSVAAMTACAALFVTTAAILADAQTPGKDVEVPRRIVVQQKDTELLVPEPLAVQKKDAKPAEKNPLDGFRFVAFDGFDGKPGLNWKTVRPDESHLSYKKYPGQLTIVTQKGSIHAQTERNNPAVAAKNIYVIDNPLASGADFVVTTCVVDFRPNAAYHQAGLILYDDDDNYLKWVFQYNWPKNGGTCFALVNETGGERQTKQDHADADPEVSKVWLRFTKRGNSYEYATSIDGERFVTQGTAEWGKSGPKQLGLIAKNGGEKMIDELDARFEFFELRAP